MDENTPIGIGVVGLGERWRKRYKPALSAMPELFRITGVHDQLLQLASKESRELKCGMAFGIVELLRHPDVEALLVADSQWTGYWPVRKAMELGKPVLCGAIPSKIDDGRGRAEAINKPESLLLVDWPISRSPLAGAVRELCPSQLGVPSTILCTINQRPSAQAGAKPMIPVQFFDLCLRLTQDHPTRVLTTGLHDGSLLTVLIELSGGKAIQLVRTITTNKPLCRLQIMAEQGIAWADVPNKLRWSVGGEIWQKTAKKNRNAARELLKEFHQRISQGDAAENEMSEVVRALRIQQLAGRSWKQGGWMNVE